MPPRDGPKLQSVRVRATVGASLVILAALLVAAALLVVGLRRSQLGSLDTALELRSVDIESLLDGGAAPTTVAVESDEDGFVLILDRNHRVLASSANVDGEALIVDSPAEGTITSRVEALGNEDFRVHFHHTDSGDDSVIVVGTSLEGIQRNQQVLIGLLAAGIPLLLLVIATLIWVVVGQALHPVEAIRVRVAEIGAGELGERVPVPPSEDEVARLATTMNAMLDRLEQSHQSQARFVSDAAHELRTPLAVFRHELEVARRANDLQTWVATGDDLLDESETMQRLVEDLLFIARRDNKTSGDGTKASGPVDLDDIVLAEAARRRTQLMIDTSAVGAGQVTGNADHLQRLARNLIDNAIRHANDTIRASVQSNQGKVVFTIEDDGPGIPEQIRSQIFDRFFVADESRAHATGGTGLGLAIVSDIVSDHGARVTVDDSPRLGGARLTVTFPDRRAP